jgi:hypothetical protein
VSEGASFSWQLYLDAVVEMELPQGCLRLRPQPPGQKGTWPAGLEAPVHVVTAWNPASQERPEEENRAAQVRLEEELSALGAVFWPAVGSDTRSDYREEGVAVVGLSEADASALAARYGQSAIYAWTPQAWAVIACDGSRRTDIGWALEHRSSP